MHGLAMSSPSIFKIQSRLSLHTPSCKFISSIISRILWCSLFAFPSIPLWWKPRKCFFKSVHDYTYSTLWFLQPKFYCIVNDPSSFNYFIFNIFPFINSKRSSKILICQNEFYFLISSQFTGLLDRSLTNNVIVHFQVSKNLAYCIDP